MFAQTVGVKPRQKSSANRICFCPQCAVSLAMGPPPEGALNMVAWDMIRDIVSAEPTLNQAAWENLRGIVGLLPAGDEEPVRRLRRAVGVLIGNRHIVVLPDTPQVLSFRTKRGMTNSKVKFGFPD
jgi:hypothetical protein